MSEAEALEVISLYYSNATDTYAIYITFTFAYLTVAYFVGAALTRFQVLVVSGLYFISALSTTIATIMPVVVWSDLAKRPETALQQSILWNGDLWILYMSVIFFGGILVSFYFMYNIRARAA